MASDYYSEEDETDVFEGISQEDETLNSDAEYEDIEENANNNGDCQMNKGTKPTIDSNCQVTEYETCQMIKSKHVNEEILSQEAEPADELAYEDEDLPIKVKIGRKSMHEKAEPLEIAERTSKSIRIFVPYPTDKLLSCPVCLTAKSRMGGGAEENKYITRHLSTHHNLVCKITFQCGICLEKPPLTSAGNARWVNTHLKDAHDWQSDLKTPTTTRKRMMDTLNSAAPSLVKKHKGLSKKFPLIKQMDKSPEASPIHRPTTRSMTKNSTSKSEKEPVAKQSALKSVKEETSTPARKLAPLFTKRPAKEQEKEDTPAITNTTNQEEVIKPTDDEPMEVINSTKVTPIAKRFNSYCLVHHTGEDAWLDSDTVHKYIDWSMESADNCVQIDPLIFSVINQAKEPEEAAEELDRYLTKDRINIMTMCDNIHWTMLIITNADYYYYDPYGKTIPPKLANIMKLLKKESKEFESEPPRQNDSHNCGVFVSLVAKSFISNQTEWFSLIDVHEFREKMVSELRKRGYVLFNEKLAPSRNEKDAKSKQAPTHCDSLNPNHSIEKPTNEEDMEVDTVESEPISCSPKNTRKKPVMVRVMVHPDHLGNLATEEVKAKLKKLGMICVAQSPRTHLKSRSIKHNASIISNNTNHKSHSDCKPDNSYKTALMKKLEKKDQPKANPIAFDDEAGWIQVKPKKESDDIPNRILPPKLTDIKLKKYNCHQKPKKQDVEYARVPTKPKKDHIPKSVDQLMDNVRTWYKNKMSEYVASGKNFKSLEWISQQLMVLINKAEAGDSYTVEKVLKREPPIETAKGEMSTQTENQARFSKDTRKDTHKNEEPIKELYFKNRGKAFNRIIGTEYKQCAIQPDKLESYFRSTMPNKITSECAIDDITSGLPQLNIPQDLMSEFSAKEILKYLDKTKDTKPGTDGVKYSHLKHFDSKGDLLALLYNECLHHKKIPAKWKESETILIYKAGDEGIAENWRPISLLSCAYKVYSGLLNNRIKRVAGLISKCQRGFQERNGCNESIGILRTAIEVTTSLNRNIAISWLDLKNAFGSVPHQLISKSLESFGFPQEMIDVINDIYDGSTMVVKSKHGLTKPIPITSGVKQGDVISPTLFNICLEPIIRRHLSRARGHKSLSTNVKILCFADDMAVICNDREQLQYELDSLDQDCRSVNLVFKPPKCASLLINRGEVDTKERILINHQSIRSLSKNATYKYLGVPTGAEGRCTEVQRLSEVTQQMDKLNQSDLAPYQKLDALKCFVLPQLTHMYANSTPKLSDLREFSTMTMRAAKAYHNIPISGSPREYVEVPISSGGLGLASPTNTCLLQFLSSTFSKLWSEDKYVNTVYNNFLTRLTQKHTGKRVVTVQDKVDYLNNKKGLASPKAFNIFTRLREVPKVLSVIKGSPFYLMEYVKDMDDIAIRLKATEISDEVYVTKNDPKKLTKIMKKELDKALTYNFINQKDVKSRVFQVVQQHPQSNSFVRKGKNISIGAHKFVHAARLNQLVCNANNFDKTKPKSCRRCNYENESQLHILQQCNYSLPYGITRRHDQVVDRVVKEIEKGKKKDWEMKIDQATMVHRDRPDISIRSCDGRTVLLADVTIVYENGIKAMQKAWDHKIHKYQHLVEYYKGMNIKSKVLPIVIGSLGTYWKPTTESLRELGLQPGAIRNFIPEACSGVLETTKNIYWRHIFGESYNLLTERDKRRNNEEVQRRRDYWRKKNGPRTEGSHESRQSNN